MNDGYDWIVDIDLEKFFDTVNHDKLMALMGKMIKGGETISIIRETPASGIKENNEYRKLVMGIWQGGNLSPPLANIMWNELNEEMGRRGLSFARYIDDYINMVGDEMSVKRVMGNTTRFIREKLGLKINTTKSRVDKPQGVKYLGYGLYFGSRAH